MVDIIQLLSSSQENCYSFSVTQTLDISKLILQNCPLFSRKQAFLVYLVYFIISEVHYLYFCFIYLLASSCSFSLLYISNTTRKKKDKKTLKLFVSFQEDTGHLLYKDTRKKTISSLKCQCCICKILYNTSLFGRCAFSVAVGRHGKKRCYSEQKIIIL